MTSPPTCPAHPHPRECPHLPFGPPTPPTHSPTKAALCGAPPPYGPYIAPLIPLYTPCATSPIDSISYPLYSSRHTHHIPIALPLSPPRPVPYSPHRVPSVFPTARLL